jgi:hypothetical protein
LTNSVLINREGESPDAETTVELSRGVLTQLQQLGNLAQAKVLKFLETGSKGRHYRRVAGSA